MKKFVKVISIACVLTMCLSMLAGCGKKEEPVTAESLLAGAFGTDEMKSIDADIKLSMDASFNLAEMFNMPDDDNPEEDEVVVNEDIPENVEEATDEVVAENEDADEAVEKTVNNISEEVKETVTATADEAVDAVASETEETVDETESVEQEVDENGRIVITADDIGDELAIKLDANMNCVANETVSHIKGDLTAEFFGMNETVPIETYVEKTETGFTSYTLADDVWTKQALSEDENEMFKYGETESMISNKDNFTELKMLENETEYVVTGKISSEKITSLYANMSDELSSMSGVSAITCDFDVTMTFDKETKLVKTITASIADFEADGCNFKSIEITLTINKINDVEVAIPDEVKANAVDAEETETDKPEVLDDEEPTVEEPTDVTPVEDGTQEAQEPAESETETPVEESPANETVAD